MSSTLASCHSLAEMVDQVDATRKMTRNEQKIGGHLTSLRNGDSLNAMNHWNGFVAFDALVVFVSSKMRSPVSTATVARCLITDFLNQSDSDKSRFLLEFWEDGPHIAAITGHTNVPPGFSVVSPTITLITRSNITEFKELLDNMIHATTKESAISIRDQGLMDFRGSGINFGLSRAHRPLPVHIRADFPALLESHPDAQICLNPKKTIITVKHISCIPPEFLKITVPDT